MKQSLLMAALVAAFLVPTFSASAASEAECSIWLCLPTGFPSGCEDAKSAFKKRIKKFKPPLPALSSCIVSVENTPTVDIDLPKPSKLTAKDGIGAYIPKRKVCVRWKSLGSDDPDVCVEQKTIPTHVVKGSRCYIHKDDHRVINTSPNGCSKTVRYVDTYMDGNQYGETYYFDDSGKKVVVPRVSYSDL